MRSLEGTEIQLNVTIFIVISPFESDSIVSGILLIHKHQVSGAVLPSGSSTSQVLIVRGGNCEYRGEG